MYVPLSGALIAPLNAIGPSKPDCAAGTGQVTDGMLVEVVDTVERVVVTCVVLDEGLCVEESVQVRVLEVCGWLTEELWVGLWLDEVSVQVLLGFEEEGDAWLGEVCAQVFED